MGETKIEWATTTWNPVTGCDKVSPGCKNCYAERMAKRLAGRFGYPADDPFRVALHPDRLEEPLHWRKPRRVFVCSMGDLFHEDVPGWDFSYDVLSMAKRCQRHTFLFLTKRPQRMKEVVDSWYLFNHEHMPWPNLWFGVTAEDQKRADERVPILLQIPAAVRFVSVEPMLGPITLEKHDISEPDAEPPEDGCWEDWLRGTAGRVWGMTGFQKLDWVICGAETGPGKRSMKLDWARSLRDQAQSADVPFFFKRDSIKGRLLDGRLWEEYPDA